MVHTFAMASVVRGYYEYKDVWSVSIDKTELPCKRELGKPRDTLAVVVIEQSPNGELTFGHVP